MTESFEVDQLRLYYGDPYPVSDKIIVFQPSIQGIMDYGESEFYTMLFTFIGNTTMRRLFLWDNGVDWNKISDYELFCSLVRLYNVEATSILFGDIDFSSFDLYEKEAPEKPQPEQEEPPKKLSVIQKNKLAFQEYEDTHTLYNQDADIEIDAKTYHAIAGLLREMFKISPKTEYTVGKTSKELLIKEERDKLKRAAKEENGSTLLPLISFCCNHPGFKYKKNELREVQIYEFMDSVKRLQVWEATHALYGGMYSGFCDTSKIPRSQFDFMRNTD